MNGVAFLIYTTSEGGYFKTMRETDDNLFADVVKRGFILKRNIFLEDHLDEIGGLVLLARAVVTDNHDFVLEGPRG